jgi:hypothetical protein
MELGDVGVGGLVKLGPLLTMAKGIASPMHMFKE